jgi:alkyl hydroperoxide reductase subunit AhpC
MAVQTTGEKENVMQVGCGMPTGGLMNQPTPADNDNTPVQESQKEETTMGILVGNPAPDFVAPAYKNGNFESVKLSDRLGEWTLLCFYPGDYTFVCTTEVADVSAHYDQLQELGVGVISVSVDSVFVHKMWNDNEISKMTEGGVPWAMASDGAGEIGKAYGVYDEAGGVDVRGRFLIDPDGIIQAMEILSPPVGRNVNELIRQIKAYQHVRDTDGAEVTPANWTPGGVTLKPGPELVGRVWEQWQPAADPIQE